MRSRGKHGPATVGQSRKGSEEERAAFAGTQRNISFRSGVWLRVVLTRRAGAGRNIEGAAKSAYVQSVGSEGAHRAEV